MVIEMDYQIHVDEADEVAFQGVQVVSRPLVAKTSLLN
jgi:hypothetical protein